MMIWMLWRAVEVVSSIIESVLFIFDLDVSFNPFPRLWSSLGGFGILKDLLILVTIFK